VISNFTPGLGNDVINFSAVTNRPTVGIDDGNGLNRAGFAGG
jgi:hypothetical protein